MPSKKVRIYDLAKQLKITTKQMLGYLDDIGVEYKSHSSTIELDTAEMVKQLVEETQREAKEKEKLEQEKEKLEAEKAYLKSLPHRAPIVAVMGHVDHGKTSLLDYIRKTRVAEKEAGGITQHIGAYQAKIDSGLITFLDTPGHEAFTSIRRRGAHVTDIAIIVVAADDSIMPQTREAIAHARAAKVPIIIAINKTDLPAANIDKVMQDLVKIDLIPEAYGGQVVTVPISAKSGKGIDDLLETISLVAELEDLRSNPKVRAKGTIIESILDKRAGVKATMLVQEGTLRVGDYIVSNLVWAKVRALIDYSGKHLKEAGPGVPVQILGFNHQPVAGDSVEQVEDEKTAKEFISQHIQENKPTESEEENNKHVTLAELFGKPQDQKINLILRADTQGSLEALRGVIAKEAEGIKEISVEIMLDAVGAPTESDLLLAGTANATVMSFGVNAPASVKKLAEKQGTTLKSYRIIYDLIEDVQRLIRGRVEPEYEEQITGHAEVRMVIKVPRQGLIAGSYVTDGIIKRGAKARVFREEKEVYKGSIAQLKRFKDDVREVASGFECGINLQNYDSFQEGDIIEAYELVEILI